MLHSASRLILIIIINIIINVKNKKLLRSIIVTAKSRKKMKGDKYINEKFHKLERVYRDCIKRTRDKTRIIQYTA